MSTEVKPKEVNVKSSEVQSEESPWYVFCSEGCGFCKKAEPIYEELNASGKYPQILKLDLAEGDNQKLNQELKKEYNIQCGTPWFINAETGSSVCGYREKDVLEKWLNGEEIPQPPRPKGPPPAPPQDWTDQVAVKAWEKGYEAWKEENKHMPNLPDTQTTKQRLQEQQQRMKQQQAAQGAAAPANKEVTNRLQVLEGKLGIIEGKLDQIISKQGA